MKLPTQKRILREDIKDAPDWIRGVIDPVNSFMEFVYQALNHNITFSENVTAFYKDLTYKTTASYPAADDVSFTNTLKVKATAIWVVQAVDTAYNPAPGPVYAPWNETNGMITIKAITGLEASKTYNIRLLVT